MPSVRLSEAIGPVHLAALFADRHCGNDTKLIWYMTMGELLSREITAKDTHSVTGDLLVSYTEVGADLRSLPYIVPNSARCDKGAGMEGMF